MCRVIKKTCIVTILLVSLSQLLDASASKETFKKYPNKYFIES